MWNNNIFSGCGLKKSRGVYWAMHENLPQPSQENMNSVERGWAGDTAQGLLYNSSTLYRIELR